MGSDDRDAPAWLSEENDAKHSLDENESLLFGTGTVNLADPEAPPEAVDYGSLSKTRQSEDNESDEDEEKTELVADTKFVKQKKRDPASLAPHRPRQNACLWLFHLLEGISCVTSLCLLVTQLLPFFLVKFSDIPKQIGVLSMALKLYISCFCVLFVLTESNLPIVRMSPLLHNWISRGFLYSFLGLVCVEEAYSERIKDIVAHANDEFHVGWAAVFMEVSSWFMLGTGLIYLLLGTCCMNRLRDRFKDQERDAWRKYREDLKDWKEKYS